MSNGRIDENGLPLHVPGDYDYVRAVRRDTGASVNVLAPEVTAAARQLSGALDQVVADAEADIVPVIAGLGYLPPVPFASGLNVNSSRFTVTHDGQVYAPVSWPFTTTGTFDPAQWRLVQGVTGADLASPYGADMVGVTTPQGVSLNLATKVNKSAQIGVLPRRGMSGKVIMRRNSYDIGLGNVGSRYWLCTPKQKSRGYLFIEMRRGSLTTTDSLGVNAEFLRVTNVWDMEGAWLGSKSNAGMSSSAHWTANTYIPSGFNERYDHASAVRNYWSLASSVASGTGWIEFDVPFNQDGRANLQFYATPTSSQGVEVSIDGVLYETISLRSDETRIYRYWMRATPGVHRVRVYRPVTGSPVHVFGYNFADVSEYSFDVPPEGFACWGNTTRYTSGEGASDYAIREQDTNLWGGSYHGGETLQAEQFIADSMPVDIPHGGLVTAQTLEVRQQTTIDWGSGKTVGVESTHLFDEDSGYALITSFSGPAVSAVRFFSVMHTTPKSFSRLVYPVDRDFTTYPSGWAGVPRSNMLVQEDPSTGQRIYVEIGLLGADDANVLGGADISNVANYNKIYYGPVVDRAAGVGNVTASVRKVFI